MADRIEISLLSLTREDEDVVERHEAVKSEVIAYFHRVLGVDQMPRVLNKEVMESAINLKLSSTQQHVLAQDVTRFDILTQKHYESNVIRHKIENQSQRYPIDPKISVVIKTAVIRESNLSYF
jgi:H2-forming N5,N10-methylenetetrahydromethanopterin dehydrogenase-like enzyme